MSSQKRGREEETDGTGTKRPRESRFAAAPAQTQPAATDTTVGGDNNTAPPTRKRKSRFSDNAPAAAPVVTAPAIPTAESVKAALSNAADIERRIAEAKARAAAAVEATKKSVELLRSNPLGSATSSLAEATRQKHLELQERLKALGANLPGVIKDSATKQPAALILDKEGRLVDEKGNVIKDSKPMVATLKANLASQKKQTVNPYLSHRAPDPSDKANAFDARLKVKKRETRGAKSLHFVSEGVYIKQGEKLRQTEAKKILAGHSSGRNPNAHNKEGIAQIDAEEEEKDEEKKEESQPAEELPSLPEEFIPEVEWWDAQFLPKDIRKPYLDHYLVQIKGKKTSALAPMVVGSGQSNADPSSSPSSVSASYNQLRLESVREWELVQHPPKPRVLIKQTDGPVTLPLYLTKKERKRIRRQNRAEREKEKQDKIALGLAPPPEPKVRLANMMRVLGEQAVADPSQIEKKVREQMAERQMNHDMRNLARKLTPEERREKKKQKMQEDLSHGIFVALFRVRDLSDPKIRFKVDVNAQENNLTGGVLICKEAGVNLVVVEGGRKAVKKFTKLMVQRIDWSGTKSADHQSEEEDSDEEEKKEEDLGPKKGNHCDFVWQGEVIKKAFSNFRFQECRTPATARKVMEAKNVAHYWDMVYKPDPVGPTAEIAW